MPEEHLTQDFDAHVLFTFMQIPDAPPLANRVARVKRWFIIAFAETWLAVLLYRVKLRLRAAHIPLLPGLCDLISRALFRVQIGDKVEIGRGLMVSHGNVVIDGHTKIGNNCQINPWVTIGLSNSKKVGFSAQGPTIGDHVHVGTGAKIIGPVTIGDYVRIGANAVVVSDVPPNVTVVGIPARVVDAKPSIAELSIDGSGRDERLAAHMRAAIVDYRIHRQSLRSLVETLHGSFEIGSDRLRSTANLVHEDMVFLDAATAADSEQTPQVIHALQAIDAALAPYTHSVV